MGHMVLPLIDFNCQNLRKFIYKLSEHATTRPQSLDRSDKTDGDWPNNLDRSGTTDGDRLEEEEGEEDNGEDNGEEPEEEADDPTEQKLDPEGLGSSSIEIISTPDITETKVSENKIEEILGDKETPDDPPKQPKIVEIPDSWKLITKQKRQNSDPENKNAILKTGKQTKYPDWLLEYRNKRENPTEQDKPDKPVIIVAVVTTEEDQSDGSLRSRSKKGHHDTMKKLSKHNASSSKGSKPG